MKKRPVHIRIVPPREMKLISMAEVARRLGVSVSTVRRYADRNLPALDGMFYRRGPRRQRVFSEAAVEVLQGLMFSTV